MDLSDKIKQLTRNAKIKNEVVAQFRTAEQKDAVRTYATNLADKSDCGIRLEIPQHLIGTFQLLFKYIGQYSDLNLFGPKP